MSADQVYPMQCTLNKFKLKHFDGFRNYIWLLKSCFRTPFSTLWRFPNTAGISRALLLSYFSMHYLLKLFIIQKLITTIFLDFLIFADVKCALNLENFDLRNCSERVNLSLSKQGFISRNYILHEFGNRIGKSSCYLTRHWLLITSILQFRTPFSKQHFL